MSTPNYIEYINTLDIEKQRDLFVQIKKACIEKYNCQGWLFEVLVRQEVDARILYLCRAKPNPIDWLVAVKDVYLQCRTDYLTKIWNDYMAEVMLGKAVERPQEDRDKLLTLVLSP